MSLDRVRQTAFKAARRAGVLLKERLGKIKDIDYKGAFNIVTDVDKASERLILDALQEDFPDWGVLAEEGGGGAGGAKCRWLVDPIDGTTNYTHGYPFFSISIAAEDSGKIVFGLVFNPLTEELFWAEAGKGAWLGESQIKVSRISSLGNSLLATGFPPDTRGTSENNLIQFATLTHLTHGVRRDGSAALDLCFVACGRLDGFWERKLSPWDTAAGSLIVREGGGRVTDLGGRPFAVQSAQILASNGLIHDELLAVLIRTGEMPDPFAKFSPSDHLRG